MAAQSAAPVGRERCLRDQIDWYMRQADGKPVLWPNIGVRRGNLYVNHLFAAEAKVYNAALDDAARHWPNLHILDWAAVVHADAGRDAWIKNEVHVTKTGEAKRWQLIISGYHRLTDDQ